MNESNAAYHSFLQKINKKDDKKNAKDVIRHSLGVECGIVRGHISRYFCDHHDNDGVDRWLGTIQSVHNDLIMHHHEECSVSPACQSKIRLSIPPGLLNLGATCYLNSQLQCLAQNLGFVHGVFSWTRPLSANVSDLDNMMNNVLETMQSVLAGMRYGPESVVCTNNFASALSLENNEMQDPNEVCIFLFIKVFHF